MSEDKLSRLDILDRARIVDLDKGLIVISASTYDVYTEHIRDTPHGHGVFPLDTYKDTKTDLSELIELIKEISGKNVRFISNRKTSGYKEHDVETHLKKLNNTVKGEYIILYYPEQHVHRYSDGGHRQSTIRNINIYIDELSKNNAVLIISDARVILNLEMCTREEYLAKGYISFHGGYFGG